MTPSLYFVFLTVTLAICTCTPVNTTSGLLNGVITPSGTGYLGIKYGKADRFAASSLYGPSSALVSAVSLPPYCPQVGQTDISEDCLYLNVYVPDTNSSSLPVMVWVHGGSFEEGGSADPTFDGFTLAHEQDVIVVTLNYRLGTLGFYLDQDDGTSPSQAASDVVTALQWVQENIAAFGGDKTVVTLFGESSGATLIRALSTSPSLVSLYSRVIMDSDPQLGNELSVGEAHVMSNYVLEASNCSSTKCLRDKSIAELLQGEQRLPQIGQLFPNHTTFFNPWVDGKIVAGDFSDLAQSGKIPGRPFLVGTVKNESAAALAPLAELASVNQLPPYPYAEIAVLTQALGNNSALIAELLSNPTLFPPSSSNATDQIAEVTQLSIFATKLEFECPTALNAKYLRQAGNPVYLFRFDKGVRYSANQGSPLCSDPNEVCHEDDLNAIFGNVDPTAAVGLATRHAWGEFARTDSPGWNVVDAYDEHLYSIGMSTIVAAGANDPYCAALYGLEIYS